MPMRGRVKKKKPWASLGSKNSGKNYSHPAFRRRHYRKLAAALKRQNKNCKFSVVCEVSAMLEADNTNFSRTQFLAACGWTVNGRRIK